MSGLYIVYLRVSTTRQGESGLGLEAQRRAVADYLSTGGGQVLGEYEEIESGKRSDRPALAEAIEHCKRTGARLLIAKLDRLSRDAHFLLGLQKDHVDFVAADMPEANKLTVGILALVAQEEREAISRRTKEALASVKARIVQDGDYTTRGGRVITRLGNPNAPKVKLGSAAGVAAFKANADAFAASIAPTARALLVAEGSFNRVAARLNALKVKTARNGRWTSKAVQRVLLRVDDAGLAFA